MIDYTPPESYIAHYVDPKINIFHDASLSFKEKIVYFYYMNYEYDDLIPMMLHEDSQDEVYDIFKVLRDSGYIQEEELTYMLNLLYQYKGYDG